MERSRRERCVIRHIKGIQWNLIIKQLFSLFPSFAKWIVIKTRGEIENINYSLYKIKGKEKKTLFKQ